MSNMTHSRNADEETSVHETRIGRDDIGRTTCYTAVIEGIR